jgi:hypothetical protein
MVDYLKRRGATQNDQLTKTMISEWLRGIARPTHTWLKNRRPRKSVPKQCKPPPPSNGVPFLLLISLGGDYSDISWDCGHHFYAAVQRRIKVVGVTTGWKALEYMDHPDLIAVFVTDGAIAQRRESYLATKLVEFVKEGGQLVFSGNFSSSISFDKLEVFFSQYWGVEWRMGEYYRTTFELIEDHPLVQLNPSLRRCSAKYSMKAVHLKRFTRDTAMYKPTEGARLQSMVFPATPITNVTESPVLHMLIGKGTIGYVGDVNREEGSTAVCLAMLGLLDYQYPQHVEKFPQLSQLPPYV